MAIRNRGQSGMTGANGRVAEARGGDWPLEDFLTYRLARLESRIMRQAIAVLRSATGLKLPEWRVIALLATRGEMNAVAIGDITGADAGLLSRTFRALERRGLIGCRRCVDDRRAVVASLTEAGWDVYAQTMPFMQARQQFLMAALTPRERDVLFGIIDKLDVAAAARGFGENAP